MSLRRAPAICKGCGVEFQALVDYLKKGLGLFHSRRCYHDWRVRQPSQATPTTNRRLRDDEPLPKGEPRRYVTRDGYIVYRWRVGHRSYVEALEHRVIVGSGAEHVHHINGDKTDNRPENLEPLTAREHTSRHIQPRFDVDEAVELYRAGWSLPRLGRHYGIHHVSIMRTMKRRGVQMRPPGVHHAMEETGRLRVVPLTARGCDGPIRFEVTR